MIKNLNLANDLKFQYSVNKPFPHIVIDNFFDDTLLANAADELSKFNDWGFDPTDYVKGHQINKYFAPWCKESEDLMRVNAPTTIFIMSYLNSNVVLDYLERLTGIDNLIPDPHFYSGNGVHKIEAGGKLGVHADYNWHESLHAHRRINLLLYLNKNWQEEWGGHLELWEKDMSAKSVQISPIFNRAVIFNITDDAFHGHPTPMACPQEISRLSFAMYYFTKERPESEINPPHHVIWG